MGDVRLDLRSSGVAVLTLDAPARRNSITVEMSREIVAACEAINDDAAIGAAVIRANGPAFCAGADRAVLAKVALDPSSDESFRDLLTVYDAFARVGRLSVPTITAVHGTAVGAGLNLAMSGDLCMVSDDCRLVAGFLPLGVHPGGGHFTLVSRKAGPQTAAALALFGRTFTGVEAVTAGLAFAAYPVAELEEQALELAAAAGADPALSRQAAESFRLQAHAGLSQPLASRVEHAAQMWSLRRQRSR